MGVFSEQLAGKSANDIIEQQQQKEEPTTATTEETVVADEAVEKTETTTEEQTTEETTTATQPTLDDESVMNYLRENRGLSDVNSIDDLLKKPKEVIKEVEIDDTDVQGYLKFKKDTNKSLSDYTRFKQLDPENMSEEQLAKYAIKRNNPYFDDADVNDYYKDKFVRDADIDDEREVRLASRELKSEIAKGQALLSKDREDFLIPKHVDNSQQEAIEANQKAWQDGIHNIVENYKEVPISLSDDVTLKFEVKDDFSKILNSLDDVNNINKLYSNEKGDFDHAKFIDVQAKGLAFDKMKDMIYQQGLADGQLNNINKTNNKSASSQKQETPDGKVSGFANSVRDAIKGY